MFCIYLQVLVPSHQHGSNVLFAHLLSKDGGMKSYDGLDACLVVHVHDELLTSCGSHHICPATISSLTFEEIFIQT
jgi:archaeosine-15-forming tRNA-guanine transglycosylase